MLSGEERYSKKAVVHSNSNWSTAREIESALRAAPLYDCESMKWTVFGLQM